MMHYTYAQDGMPGKSDEMQIFWTEMQKAALNCVTAAPGLG
jgi:hypothetical protein